MLGTNVTRNDDNACIMAAVRMLLNQAESGWRGWKWSANCGNGGSLKCKHILVTSPPVSFTPFQCRLPDNHPCRHRHAGCQDDWRIWLQCSEVLNNSCLAAAMSSRQLTCCTLLTRSDIMVSVKLLYSRITFWCWLEHGCADQRGSFLKLRLLSTQWRNRRICKTATE